MTLEKYFIISKIIYAENYNRLLIKQRNILLTICIFCLMIYAALSIKVILTPHRFTTFSDNKLYITNSSPLSRDFPEVSNIQ